jgi:phosphoglycolate phosphatase-like HAD superfamily hydrolase
MKKIIFFDGDGTVWYPKKTKYTVKPHWIYQHLHKDHINHLMLTPFAFYTLKKLKSKGIITVLLSTHPQKPKDAEVVLKEKIKHFKLERVFDEFHATKAYPESKGEFIVKILKRRGIPKNKALMVGDIHEWDYKSAKSKGIDAVLIDSEYRKHCPNGKRIKRTIKDLREIFDYI